MAQQSEFRRSKSWRESRVKTSHIPVRKYAADTDKIGRSRLTIKSLSDLDDLSEDYYEFVPYTDIFTDTFKETADATNNEQKTNEANKVVDVVNCFTDNIKGENADILKDNSQEYAPEVDDSGAAPNYLKAKTPQQTTLDSKSGLSKLSSINEKSIDNMTSNNEEVIRSSNTQMTRGVPKSKSTDSVGEGKIKKSGVQLRRCLSLYDRKRNPHFCKDRVLIPKEENKSRRAFGLIADENVLKKERTMPVTDGRVIANKPTRTNLQRRQTMPDKVNNAHEMGVALCTPNCNQKRKIIETWKPPRGVESDISEEIENLSTITNGTSRSMVSSTVSHESDSSSELDFDALVPIKLSSRNSDSKSTRHSLIPQRVRPLSATLSLSDGNVNDYIGNELKASRQGRNLTRSISWYEKRVTSFSNGTEVSIKIRESVSSSESSYSSTDDVFLTMPKATQVKAVEVPEDEDGYPEPAPPSTSRSDVFNPREYVQVDQHALKVPTDDLIPKTRRCRNQHSMAFQTPIANTDVYKGSFFPQTIRDWNALPDSLISSAEDAEDCVAKFTSLVRARD